MNRHFYYIVRERSQGTLYAGGSLLSRHESVQSAITAGVRLALANARRGEDAEVLVQNENGRYGVVWTRPTDRADCAGA